ncbi:MAG: isoprenylcysteine carboxylmethyltransferase family protein [Candidatus Brocadiia bacterium]
MKENNGEHPLGDAGQILLGLVFMALWSVDSFVLKLSIFLSGSVPVYIRIIIALILAMTAIVLFLKGHIVVRDKVRPVTVISTGIFKYVRHPLYLASLLFFLRLVAFSLSILSLGLWIVIFLFYNYIAGYEEQVMADKFGAAYQDYKKRTGKWLPKLTS